MLADTDRRRRRESRKHARPLPRGRGPPHRQARLARPRGGLREVLGHSLRRPRHRPEETTLRWAAAACTRQESRARPVRQPRLEPDWTSSAGVFDPSPWLSFTAACESRNRHCRDGQSRPEEFRKSGASKPGHRDAGVMQSTRQVAKSDDRNRPALIKQPRNSEHGPFRSLPSTAECLLRAMPSALAQFVSDNPWGVAVPVGSRVIQDARALARSQILRVTGRCPGRSSLSDTARHDLIHTRKHRSC